MQRELTEIARRSMALYLVATYAENVLQDSCPIEESQAYIKKFIVKMNADTYFTEKEREFLAKMSRDQQEIGEFCWRWESLYFLMWVLGYITDLGEPREPCMQFSVAKFFNRHRSVEDLVKFSKPVSTEAFNDVSQRLSEYENKEGIEIGVFKEWKIAEYWLRHPEYSWDAAVDQIQ